MAKFHISTMTSPNGNISALLSLCKGNPPVTGGFPSQMPVTRNFDIFFDLQTNEQTIGVPVIWDVIVLIMTSQ